MPPRTVPGGQGGPVTPRDVWGELERGGASAVQAAGIMGNWIAESKLNPEAVNPNDSNGYPSYGLAQWNAADYPSAQSLVTGNPGKDLRDQVRFFGLTGGLKAARGSTPQQVASNVAQNYERCQGCASGGSQNRLRQANAATVAGWASSGGWPATASGATDTATLGEAAQRQASATCLWQIGGGTIDLIVYHQSVPAVCVLAKSQARAIESIGVMLAGGLVMLTGLGFVLAATQSGQLLPIAAKLAAVFPK